MNGSERPMAPKPRVWPVSYQSFCGVLSVKGPLCAKHLGRVRAYAGRWECSWPGCERLSPAKRGLCSFHFGIAAGEAESYPR